MQKFLTLGVAMLLSPGCATASEQIADGNYIDRQSMTEIVVNGSQMEIHFPRLNDGSPGPAIKRYSYQLAKNGSFRIYTVSSDEFLREIEWHDWRWDGTRIERTSHRDQRKTLFEPAGALD